MEGGPPVFNRTVTLRDTWAKRTERTADEKKAAGKFADLEPEAKRKERQEPPQEIVPKDPLAGLAPVQVERARRYEETYGLTLDDAAILASDPEVGQLYERAVAEHDNPAALANWVIHELLRELKERELHELPIDAAGLADLVRLVDDGEISSAAAKQVFEVMVSEGGRPREIVERRGLRQVSDEAELSAEVDAVIAAHPDEAERYRGGETRLHGWFVGQVMRAARGTATPQRVNDLLRERLGG